MSFDFRDIIENAFQRLCFFLRKNLQNTACMHEDMIPFPDRQKAGSRVQYGARKIHNRLSSFIFQ